LPAGQSEHEPKAGIAAYLPASHAKQLSLVEATTALAQPAAQPAHSVEPVALCHLPAGQSAQLWPPIAVNCPTVHGTHLAAAALVLPTGDPEPAVHGVPSQAERAPAAAACVPLGQGVQPALQRHCLLLLHEMVEVLRVLK
jgi:hypothetical protein